MTEHPRVTELVAHYRTVDAIMRELPLYNHALAVEPWGFEALPGGELFGVLVTPWFMNYVLLPAKPEPVAARRYGERRTIALPAGERAFRYAGDISLGAFWTSSLHSPMEVFRSQAQARAEARLQHLAAMTPPEAETPKVACPSRRGMFLPSRGVA
jgi:[NiFe] hydrogenase assembly HybE family chaperone